MVGNQSHSFVGVGHLFVSVICKNNGLLMSLLYSLEEIVLKYLFIEIFGCWQKVKTALKVHNLMYKK